MDVPPFGWFPWWATLFTSMFVHGGWLHLLFNMWYLWIFGNNVEDAMTRPRFVVFYFACGMVGDDGAGARRSAQRRAAHRRQRRDRRRARRVPRALPARRVLTVIPLIIVWPVFEVPAWILLVIWFVLQGVGGAQSFGSGEAGVAFFAHLGGFVAGMALVLLFARRAAARARRRAAGARRRV